MAEYCRVPHEFVIPLDPRLSFIEAATIPANYGTMFRMLFTNGDMQPERSCAGSWRERRRRHRHGAGRQGARRPRHRLRRHGREMRPSQGARRRPRHQLQHARFFTRGLAHQRQEGRGHLRQLYRRRHLESVHSRPQGAWQVVDLRGHGRLRRAHRYPLHLAARGEDLRIERLHQGRRDPRHGRDGAKAGSRSRRCAPFRSPGSARPKLSWKHAISSARSS